MSQSWAEILADLPEDEAWAILEGAFPGQDLARVANSWDYLGRPEQIWRPGSETYTVYIAGRGWGKTACGAHAVHYMAQHPELCGGRVAQGPDDRRAGEGALIGIAGRTANDVNQTMVDGDSGIMASCGEDERPEWNKQACTLWWPRTSVKARLMSGDVPSSFRGPNFGGLWVDELPHWSRADASWKECRRAFRKAAPGQHRRAVVTSTPLATEVTRRLVWLHRDGHPVPATADTPPEQVVQGHVVAPRTRVVQGSTYENVANLDADYLLEIGQHEGTADAAQEHHAQIRLDTPGAPVRLDWIRRCETDEITALDDLIVAVDPTGSDGERVPRSDLPCECGIVAQGFDRTRRRVYGLADRSLVGTPRQWADVVIELCLGFGIRTVVAEQNFGGLMVQEVVAAAYQRRRSDFKAKGLAAPRIILRKATVGKLERAQLCGPAFEAGKVWHVGSPRHWITAERQWTTLDPNRPIRGQQTDRLDAEGWGILHFLGDGTDRARVSPLTTAEAWTRIAAGMGRAAQGR
jgi:phage terminase large subunit-like protein